MSINRHDLGFTWVDTISHPDADNILTIFAQTFVANL
jgi:hypothetical protein